MGLNHSLHLCLRYHWCNINLSHRRWLWCKHRRQMWTKHNWSVHKIRLDYSFMHAWLPDPTLNVEIRDVNVPWRIYGNQLRLITCHNIVSSVPGRGAQWWLSLQSCSTILSDLNMSTRTAMPLLRPIHMQRKRKYSLKFIVYSFISFAFRLIFSVSLHLCLV